MNPIPDRIKSDSNGGSAMIALAAFLAVTGLVQSQLSPAEFEELHRLLQPTKPEPWQNVPWKLSIRDAQNQAAKEKKPIFMLVRSGHPLGCV